MTYPSPTSPLPTHFNHGRRFRGRRIALLPGPVLRWAEDNPNLPPLVRAACRAQLCFRVMEDDQRTGRL